MVIQLQPMRIRHPVMITGKLIRLLLEEQLLEVLPFAPEVPAQR